MLSESLTGCINKKTTFIHLDKLELPEVGSDQTRSTFKLSWDQYTAHNERTIL